MIQSARGHTKCNSTPQITMTREERLRQANNGKPEDEVLERLILAVWAIEKGSFAYRRRRAIEKLVTYTGGVFKTQFKFNKKWKNYTQESDPVYSRDVEFDALVYLSLHIDEFVPDDGYSIKDSLKFWIERNAINKGIDDFRKQERRDLKPLSSDIGFKGRKEEENISWEIGDRRESGLDVILSKLDRRVRQEFLEYIQTDPDGKLAGCAMKDDRCNCFVLVQLMYFRQPNLNQTQAAAELGFIDKNGKVEHQGLRSHWKRNCQPLLKEIVKEIAKKYGHEFD
jgi:hypothetical protein